MPAPSGRIPNEIAKLTKDNGFLFQINKYSNTTKQISNVTVRFTEEGIQYVFNVTFPDEYPFKAPQVQMISPYEQDYFIDENRWGSTKNLLILKELIHQPFKYGNRYLLLGGYPSDSPTRSRALYMDPRFFILDTVPELNVRMSPFKSRYIEADFNDLERLQAVADDYRGAFQKIIFDWSTYKFFNHDDTYEDRLGALLQMLTPDGNLVIESPQGTMFSFDRKMTQDEMYKNRNLQMKTNRSDLTTAIRNLGFQSKDTDISRILDPVLVQVYKPLTNDLELSIVGRQMGGKRQARTQKTKRRKTLKRRVKK